MKLIFYISFAVLFFVKPIYAQQGRDKLELLRVNFINQNVELTSAEAEKFWPIYNEYNDKLKAVKRNLRQSYRKKPSELTERDAEELYQLELQSRLAETELYKQYSEKIKAIIGVKKFVKLRVAEEKFKQEVIKTIKDREG